MINISKKAVWFNYEDIRSYRGHTKKTGRAAF